MYCPNAEALSLCITLATVRKIYSTAACLKNGTSAGWLPNILFSLWFLLITRSISVWSSAATAAQKKGSLLMQTLLHTHTYKHEHRHVLHCAYPLWGKHTHTNICQPGVWEHVNTHTRARAAKTSKRLSKQLRVCAVSDVEGEFLNSSAARRFFPRSSVINCVALHYSPVRGIR